MRLSHAVLAIVLLLAASCAGSSPHATASSSSPPPAASNTPIAPMTATAVSLGPLDPSMPEGAMFRLAIDPAAIDAWMARIVPNADTRLMQGIAELVGTDIAALRAGHLSTALSIDPTRSVQIAVAPLTTSEIADAERIHRLSVDAETNPSESTRAALLAATRESRSPVVAIRASVPTTDAAPVLELVIRTLRQTDWVRLNAPEGIEDFFATPDAQGAIAISRAPGLVVFDLYLAPFAAPTRNGPADPAFVDRMRAIASTTRRRAPGGPHTEPLASDGDAIRFEFAPAALAPLNLFFGLGAMNNALAGLESRRDDIALVGIHEADRSYFLVRNDRGAFFDRIAVSLRSEPTITIRADLGPGGELPPEAVWPPSPSVRMPGSIAQLDLATAFLSAWNLPGGAPTNSRHEPYLEATREAGFLGLLMSLPYAIIAAARQATGDGPRPFPERTQVLQRFERYTVLTRPHPGSPAPEEIYVGLFPANTNPNTAACILVPDGERCTLATRLPLDRTVAREGRGARLSRVGDRLLLLVGSSPAEVNATRLERTAMPVAPARFLLDIVAVSDHDPLATLVPGVFAGDVTHEGRRLVFTMRPSH